MAPSPREAQALTLDPGDAVVDFDVSPIRPEAALVTRGKLLFWQIGGATRSVALPADLKVSAIAWHPLGQSLFLLATRGKQQEILKTPSAGWAPTTLYRSKSPLRRLVAGPRPFDPVGYDEDESASTAPVAYRVFFGVKQADGKYATHSVTENGDREYTVPDVALPAGFHPSGHLLLWEDDKHCFHRKAYDHLDWGGSSPLNICKGSLTYTPNGAGLLQWQSGTNGVTLRLDKPSAAAKDVRFESTPSSVADGRGIVGVTREGVRYVPIDVPLADVVNAWMFLENPSDRELFSANTGLFRPLQNDQLYQLYDSENYDYCSNSYDRTTPTRPYLVTTDIFWELYAAAFEGTFILSEKQVAVAAFWRFVQGANESLKGQPKTRAAAAFAALVAVRDGKADGNPEAARILRSEGVSDSSVTGESFDFGNLKPRSHYARDPDLQRYFRAFRYLTDLKLAGADLEPLRTLPRPVVQDAMTWIGAYLPFIAPSRERIVWDSGKVVFPLSWGFDNEAMFRTVFHPSFPPEEQIAGPGGRRFLPSGLDVAAVFGSALAESLLEESGEFQKYPPLRPRIAALKKRFGESRGESLYQRWLSGLAAQWSEPPGGAIDRKIWSRKRLQTGLASWATLRHTTLLVNERGEAECGEAGFEAIVLRAPRGYVEPDPATFEAIAGLFDATLKMVKSQVVDQSLKDGLIQRLTESRDKTLVFRDIAKKELAGQPLTAQEYEEIMYVGRAAEHNFLIFKSLAQKDFALSTPDPVSKVADVFGSTSLLLAGVGAPLEWDQVIPFFGRREIVKGSSYAYYETVSAQVMDDAEWRKKLPDLPRPKWIQPFVSPASLSCPAQAP